jgi:hypothetical protein
MKHGVKDEEQQQRSNSECNQTYLLYSPLLSLQHSSLAGRKDCMRPPGKEVLTHRCKNSTKSKDLAGEKSINRQQAQLADGEQ